MKSIIVIVLIIIGGAAFALLRDKDQAGTTPEQQQTQNSAEPVILQLTEQNSSGQNGTATISDFEGGTKVVIDVPPAGEGISQPAHIHVGTCDNLGSVRYTLTNVIDGKSETVLPPALHFIHGLGQSAINIHKSTEEPGVYTSCGDLTAALDAVNHQ